MARGWWSLPLGRLRVVSLGVAVLGFVLACGLSETEQLDKRWAELGVPEAEFVFLGEVTSSEQETIRRELRVAQVVFAEHFGAVTSDFRVYVSTNLDLLNEQIAVEHGGRRLDSACNGAAVRTAVFLSIEECPDADDYGQILAHEYFHMLQYDAGTLMGWAQGGLRWTFEGSAVYAAALFNEAQGRRTLAALRRGKQLAWAGGLVEGARYAYDFGFLATDWLAERAGTEAVLEFFSLGGHRAAFQSAFGMHVDSFQSAFRRHLTEVAPAFTWKVGGRVVGSDELPVEGVEVFAAVRIEGEPRLVAMAETDSQGSFELLGPGNGFVLGLFVRCPGDDATPKWAYAGELGADGFVVDESGIYDDEAKGAEPFADGERDRTGLVIEIPETRASLIAKGCEE